MGYKLAGFDVLGCNEIDPKMMEAYIANHNPKYSFLEPIQTFKERNDLPQELYELDILDGSPPCSSFSMAGKREKYWGKEKKFREGQTKQVLDTLFFDFIDLAKKLQPKIVIAENVKGLLFGSAKSYVKRIYEAFDLAGYYVQHFLLDASKMGVPQRRERVFFIALRKDLAESYPFLDLQFNEESINFEKCTIDFWDLDFDKNCIDKYAIGKEWYNLKEGESSKKYFQLKKIDRSKVCPTIIASCQNKSSASITHPFFCRKLNDSEICLLSSYPLDYNFNKNLCGFIVGMSVPPVMTAQIATQIYEQWLSKIK